MSELSHKSNKYFVIRAISVLQDFNELTLRIALGTIFSVYCAPATTHLVTARRCNSIDCLMVTFNALDIYKKNAN